MIFLQNISGGQACAHTYSPARYARECTQQHAHISLTRSRGIFLRVLNLWLFFRDSWGRRYSKIVAIDAHVFRCYTDQFQAGLLKRELDKVFFAWGFVRQSRAIVFFTYVIFPLCSYSVTKHF